MTYSLDPHDRAVSVAADTWHASCVALGSHPGEATFEIAETWVSVLLEGFEESYAEWEYRTSGAVALRTATCVALMGEIPMVGAPIESLAQTDAVESAVTR